MSLNLAAEKLSLRCSLHQFSVNGLRDVEILVGVTVLKFDF